MQRRARCPRHKAARLRAKQLAAATTPPNAAVCDNYICSQELRLIQTLCPLAARYTHCQLCFMAREHLRPLARPPTPRIENPFNVSRHRVAADGPAVSAEVGLACAGRRLRQRMTGHAAMRRLQCGETAPKSVMYNYRRMDYYFG